PGPDDAPGDVADPRHPEDLPDLRRAELRLLELGLEHALERRLDLLDRLVDDRVVADVDALAPGQLTGPFGRPDVEADDHRVGGDGQVDVILGDRADAAADHAQADLFADVELEQRVLEGFDRTGPGRTPHRRRSSRRRAACRAVPAPWPPGHGPCPGGPRWPRPGRPGVGWPAGRARRRRSGRSPRAGSPGRSAWSRTRPRTAFRRRTPR